jgi:hypothetical protein
MVDSERAGLSAHVEIGDHAVVGVRADRLKMTPSKYPYRRCTILCGGGFAPQSRIVMLVPSEDPHSTAAYIEGGPTIDIQSPGSFNVNGKILNRRIFARGYSIPGKFRPNRRIGMAGNGHHDQRGEERNTRRASQFNLFHRPTSPEKSFKRHSSGVVIVCDKCEAFGQGRHRDALNARPTTGSKTIQRSHYKSSGLF